MENNTHIAETFNVWQLLANILVLVGLALSPYLVYIIKIIVS